MFWVRIKFGRPRWTFFSSPDKNSTTAQGSGSYGSSYGAVRLAQKIGPEVWSEISNFCLDKPESRVLLTRLVTLGRQKCLSVGVCDEVVRVNLIAASMRAPFNDSVRNLRSPSTNVGKKGQSFEGAPGPGANLFAIGCNFVVNIITGHWHNNGQSEHNDRKKILWITEEKLELEKRLN
jgi:hypothetical protein